MAASIPVIYSPIDPPVKKALPIPKRFEASIARVLDGDTFLLIGKTGRVIPVRLWGADAPEFGQYGYVQAWEEMNGNVKGLEVIVERMAGPDIFSFEPYPLLTRLTLKDTGTDLSLKLIDSGWGWWARLDAPKAALYQEAERKVKAEKKGIWQMPLPLEPWLWREGYLN